MLIINYRLNQLNSKRDKYIIQISTKIEDLCRLASSSFDEYKERLEELLSESCLLNLHDASEEYLMKCTYEFHEGKLLQAYNFTNEMLNTVQHVKGYEEGIKTAIKIFKDQYNTTEETLELDDQRKFILLFLYRRN